MRLICSSALELENVMSDFRGVHVDYMGSIVGSNTVQPIAVLLASWPGMPVRLDMCEWFGVCLVQTPEMIGCSEAVPKSL